MVGAVRVAERRGAHVLRPNGKVLAIDAWTDAPNTQRVWNPVTNTFVAVAQLAQPLLRGPHLLADGKTLIVGGNVSANDGSRHDHLRPGNNSWSRGRTCRRRGGTRPRRSWATAGCSSSPVTTSSTPAFRTARLQEASDNSLPEVYNPTTNTWQSLPTRGGRRRSTHSSSRSRTAGSSTSGPTPSPV